MAARRPPGRAARARRGRRCSRRRPLRSSRVRAPAGGVAGACRGLGRGPAGPGQPRRTPGPAAGADAAAMRRTGEPADFRPRRRGLGRPRAEALQERRPHRFPPRGCRRRSGDGGQTGRPHGGGAPRGRRGHHPGPRRSLLHAAPPGGGRGCGAADRIPQPDRTPGAHPAAVRRRKGGRRPAGTAHCRVRARRRGGSAGRTAGEPVAAGRRRRNQPADRGIRRPRRHLSRHRPCPLAAGGMVLLLGLRRVLQRSAFRSGPRRSRGTARADGFLPDRRGLGAVPRGLGARPGKVAGRHEGGCRANRGSGVRPGAVDGALHRPPGVAVGEGTSRLDGDDRGRRGLRVHERLSSSTPPRPVRLRPPRAASTAP